LFSPKYVGTSLNKKNWKIEFKWMKALVGIYGKEIADRFAKEATQNYYATYSRIRKLLCNIQQDTKITMQHTAGYQNYYATYSRIPKNDTGKESIRKWQSQWEETKKRAITKEFFPSVEMRLAVNLNLSPDVTTIMTGHGNIRSCLHRLKIIGSPERPCKHGVQTVDHLTFQCKRLKNKRKILKSSVLKGGKRASE
jgi:hypothetical protein